jgi:hypothetical protein
MHGHMDVTVVVLCGQELICIWTRTAVSVLQPDISANSPPPSGQFIQYLKKGEKQCNFYFRSATVPSGPRSRHYRGFTITRTHAHAHTLGRTSPDEWSVRRRDLYLTAHTLTTDRHPCLRRDSNPLSQQASVRRPTPWRVHCSHYFGQPKIIVMNSKDSEHVRK